ncbi:bacteriocin fulvocin C-related protein [Nocardia blacklockiae]|uniref:bacteriocin fulvocin C-related protein n=1 Tax=Nocardia blacklockiae TaxID=480036 RepID=UPI0018940224|nr:bacteriocin fulvocin C-related protein [Nocardia blacklockiae]MBF6175168.1 bacteriocin fulvocin C-related protein [Nocardia blacklockiae]
MTHQRWILAFDASCGTCRNVSAVVGEACRDRIEVLSLADADVTRWRQRALGADPEWAPTLLRVDGAGEQVRAWTGSAIAIPLARRLGPVASVRVVHALGTLRRRADGAASELPGAPSGAAAVGRAQFLRLAGGAGVAAGLILTGTVPAFAAKEQESARSWVHAHRDNLPRTYEQVVEYPLSYRRQIFDAHTPQVRSTLWTDHLAHFRSTHTDFTPAQREVLDRAAELLGKESTFDGHDRAPVRARLGDLKKAAIDAFGPDRAYAAIGILGPATREIAANTCPCATTDGWCGDQHCYPASDCEFTRSGCGTAWVEPCDGRCS